LTIVARDFARIFLQNSINLGLRTIICPDVDAQEGDELEIGEQEIRNRTNGKTFPIHPLPSARQAIIDAGGLIAFTRKRLLETKGKR
jgi:3-isopropylmalate/(R)-2-methylmalate dehydratase small subunit